MLKYPDLVFLKTDYSIDTLEIIIIPYRSTSYKYTPKNNPEQMRESKDKRASIGRYYGPHARRAQMVGASCDRGLLVGSDLAHDRLGVARTLYLLHGRCRLKSSRSARSLEYEFGCVEQHHSQLSGAV